jgi:multidrug resistance efflux pump
MRPNQYLLLVGTLAAVGGCQRSLATPTLSESSAPSIVVSVSEVRGKTQPAPGRSATIAPVVLHPVIEVLVKPGDRVKKDQPLVKLDDDEPQADLRAKKAALAELQAGLARLKAQPREEERAEMRALLESARVSRKEARATFERLEKAMQKGVIPSQRYFDALAARDRYEAEERAAVARLEKLLKQPIHLEIAEMEAKVAASKANVEVSAAELEHYVVTAAIEGVVSRLEVNPGTVSRPGTSVWGEILDLREVDVRCELTPAQADQVAVGQPAELRRDGPSGDPWPGRVTFVGMTADPKSGLVPVLVRLSTPEQRLRCNADVWVRFGSSQVGQRGK